MHTYITSVIYIIFTVGGHFSSKDQSNGQNQTNPQPCHFRWECCEQRESMVYNASAQERELTYCSYSQRYTLQKYQNISQRHVIQYIALGRWQESSTAIKDGAELKECRQFTE